MNLFYFLDTEFQDAGLLMGVNINIISLGFYLNT